MRVPKYVLPFEQPAPRALEVVPPAAHSAELAAFVGTRRTSAFATKRPQSVSAAKMTQASVELDAMITRDDWTSATSIHLVALYIVLHEKVYGFAPTMDGKTRMAAVFLASRMIKDTFNASVPESVEYMRWVWARENEREAWRRANKADGITIGYRMQFTGGRMLDEYRAHRIRQRGR